MKWLKLFENFRSGDLKVKLESSIRRLLQKMQPNINEPNSHTQEEEKKLIPHVSVSDSKYGYIVTVDLKNDTGFKWVNINPEIKTREFIEEMILAIEDAFEASQDPALSTWIVVQPKIVAWKVFDKEAIGRRLGPKKGIEDVGELLMQELSLDHPGIENTIYFKFLIERE